MSGFPFRFPVLKEYTAQAEFPQIRHLHQQQNFIDWPALQGFSGEIMFSRGWASDLYFTLESECSINWHAYSQETVFHLTMFFPLPPIWAQPCGRCSLAEMGAVHTKLASNESRRYVASYSQSGTSVLPKKPTAVSPRYNAETFIGTLICKYSPGHRYRNVLLDFFKTCYPSVSTELIQFWNQIYLKL